MTNLKPIIIAALCLTAFNAYAEEDINWVDVTKRFIKNPCFDNNIKEPWEWDSNAVTQEVRVECISFYQGYFDLHQTILGLPKGHYRLSVQGFYRTTDNDAAYSAFSKGEEMITASLYAGENSQLLTSIYSFSFDYNVSGRCFTPDNIHYYPSGKEPSLAAFAQGAYSNSIEFDADGDITIGVRCNDYKSANYCALDNFKLEYASPINTDGKSWIDMTNVLLQNPGFTNNDRSGWQWNSNAGSQNASFDCMEFWNGRFNIYQTIKDAPEGKYRLSVQSFYRCQDNNNGYTKYLEGTENITGYLYGGNEQKQIVSVYSEPSDIYYSGCWTPNNNQPPYFPNTMQSARAFFDNGCYENVLDFEAGGDFSIGLRCDEYIGNNWCIFDNFKLHYYGDIVKISDITIKTNKSELVVGESTTATLIISPANATLTWVDWASSNENVATIDQTGKITALSNGTTTISATAIDGSDTKGTLDITVVRNIATPGSIIINEIMASNIDEYISPAFNFDGWIELQNTTDRPIELNGLIFSDPINGYGPWTAPQNMGTVPANGYRLVWFDSNDIASINVDFKLNVDGGCINISDANGNLISTQSYPASHERISYARLIDGSDIWGETGIPTPGVSNDGTSLAQSQLSAPIVDQPSQLFNGQLVANVTIPGGCTLRYTTDGSLPTLSNGKVSNTGQFIINNTSIYRFRLFAEDMLPSRVTSRSYILKDREYYLPVVSLITDNNFLYSSEIGIMMKGPNGKPGNGESEKCNWNMNWQRPANFSYLDTNGEMVLNQDVNLEMSGGWSRAWSPRSLKLKGEKEYGGNKNLPYQFFSEKPYIRNRTLLVRNGGNDTSQRFKDPALQYIVQSAGLNMDCQSYQPVHEFINGNYIGVLNAREPNNKHYVYANYGWDDDEIDLFEMSPDSGYVQKCGTDEAFKELVDILSANAANNDTYNEVCNVLDIDAYINYMATEFYLSNWDWPQNNIKGFRHRDNGKFRFVLFDTDNTLADSDGKAPGKNPPFDSFFYKEIYTFNELYPNTLPTITDSIRFVTLFKNLLKNSDFNRRFIDAYCIMGGSVYEKNRVSEIVSTLLDNVQPAMQLNGGSASGSANNIINYLNNHLDRAMNMLQSNTAFNLKNTTKQSVTLSTDTKDACIYINSQYVPTGSFSGYLFPPVTLKAVTPAGYRFNGWINQRNRVVSTDETYTMPSGTVNLTASFTPLTGSELAEQGITPVRINEISGSNDSFIDEYGKKGDWLELYNTTDADIDVEGMYLTDDLQKPQKYQITKGNTNAQTIIPSHGHLIIWCDNKRETTDDGIHATFKISGEGGSLALMSTDCSWTDVLHYGTHDSRTTIGRYPDGASDVYAMNVATIGKANIFSSYATMVDQTKPDPTHIYMTSAANGLRICYSAQQLIIKSDESNSVKVNIYRADGVHEDQFNVDLSSAGTRIELNTLPHGLYVAHAYDDNGTHVCCKFVK